MLSFEGNSHFGRIAQDDGFHFIANSNEVTEKLEFSIEVFKIIENDIDIEELTDNQVNKLPKLMTSWTELMQKEMNTLKDIEEGQIEKSVVTEYKFWNTRYTNFKTILQQFTSDKLVAKYIKTVKMLNTEIAQNILGYFYDTKSKFEIIYETTVKETKEKIELIYEGIFAIVMAPLSVINENTTPLYNNLILMWLTSSFYKEKKNMERLLELISNLIADRISTILSIPDIFRYTNSNPLLIIRNVLIIINHWKDRYSQCQKNIQKISEKFRKSWAWKFDENIIFKKLNFVSLVAKDLAEIIEIKQQFDFIYPHSNFIKQLCDVDNDNMYNKQNMMKDTMSKFKNCIVNNLYSNIGLQMESPQSAIKGLKALQIMEKYDIIRNDMHRKTHSSKYSIIIENLTDEINSFHTQFKSFKSSPQLLTNVPLIAGNIILVHDLHIRAKEIVKVIELATQIPSVQKNKILSTYGHFCKEIFAYENKLFSEWLRDALEIQRCSMKDALLIFRDNTLGVVFSKELFCVMDTALKLNLDYDLPEVIINLIKKRDEIFDNIENMNKLVNMYNKILDKMDASITLAMDRHLTEINRSLHPCLVKQYTYLTNHLPEFINNVMTSLNEYNIIYDRVKSKENIINKQLKLIENLEFFPADFKDGYVQEFLKMIDECKIQRNKNFSEITMAMGYICEAVNLIEKLCCGGEIGQNNKQMRLLYEKYENALFEAFTTMVLNNLKAFKKMLSNDRSIFIIYTQKDEKFILLPNIENIIIKFTREIDGMLNIMKLVKPHRWLKHINTQCPLVQNEKNSDLKLSHSFYNSVVTNTNVFNMKKECFNCIKLIGDRLKITSQKFQRFGFLFEKREELMINQFAATNPTPKDYKEKLLSFVSILKSLEKHPHVDVGCMRLNHSEYNMIIKERCDLWYSIYGKQFILECEHTITTFMDKIMTLKNLLNYHFRDVQGIFIVENTIKEIKEMIFQAELNIQEINYRFYFLGKHQIIIPENQLKQFKQLKTNWHNLYQEAIKKNLCIEDAKLAIV
ncbi:Dynein heavy chain, domain-1 [Cinara cedri]|uniref:Dynein heavy chain, domain-1 n=1 Tax=Cinara cedri TaxID=506608 RepID=A0A5E4M045_9HEMI|nr:Dynein heavy chain, domain-1 [Cinara cedri]